MRALSLTCLLIIAVINYCYGFSQPVIHNTRAEGCIEGTCGSICSWEGVKMFPQDNLNQPGKCRLLRCSSNFDIYVTPCPFDMTGATEWVDKDSSKLYPECCGKQVPRKRN